MTVTGKLCDAADWFTPELQRIITNELEETPRFHRKQWESAMIFQALEERGLLAGDRQGLSMGGGRELILYAIARYVHQLTVTDLYDPQTVWDCAKTDDPDAYIRLNKPFAVGDERLRGLRMDMRDLKFPDSTFDFCYSTCAVEHIGERADFLRHFNEVARVLKNGGVYVFTTEIGYGEETIRDSHNYVFSLHELFGILAESNLQAHPRFDAGVTRHKINYPIPSTLKQLAHIDPSGLAGELLADGTHLQLLRGKYPFTCGIFVLTKRSPESHVMRPEIVGLDGSARFMAEGVREFERQLGQTGVIIDPVSALPGGASRFFADHTEFLAARDRSDLDPETLFHTDYFWFGSGTRVFDVLLDPVADEGAEIEFRIHRFPTLDSATVDCPVQSTVRVTAPGRWGTRLAIDTDAGYSYAILAKLRQGFCLFRNVEIRSYTAGIAPPPPIGPLQERDSVHDLTNA
jgi:SAM-dependent methyltransferase